MMNYERQQGQYVERQGHHPHNAYEGGYPQREYSQPTINREQPAIYPTVNMEQPSQSYQTMMMEQQSYRYPAFPPVISNDGSTVGAIFSYTFGWLSGLLLLLFGGHNRYIRFHALQSIFFFGAINLIDAAMFMSIAMMHRHVDGPIGGLFVFFWLAMFFIVNVVGFVGWIVGMLQAARGKYYQMPVVGAVAARFADTHSPMVK